MTTKSLNDRLEVLERGRSEDLAPRSLAWFYGDEPAIKPSQAKPRTLAEFYRQNKRAAQ